MIRDCTNFRCCAAPNIPELIVTQQRARAIGIETSTPMALSLPRADSMRAAIFDLAAGDKSRFTAEAKAAESRRHGGDPARQAQPWLAGDPRGARGADRW